MVIAGPTIRTVLLQPELLTCQQAIELQLPALTALSGKSHVSKKTYGFCSFAPDWVPNIVHRCLWVPLQMPLTFFYVIHICPRTFVTKTLHGLINYGHYLTGTLPCWRTRASTATP